MYTIYDLWLAGVAGWVLCAGTMWAGLGLANKLVGLRFNVTLEEKDHAREG